MSLASRGLVTAVRLAPRVPEPLVRAGAALAAELAWLRRGPGVRRLEANLARVVPGADPAELRRLSRGGMHTYLRYYAEAFTLPGRTTAEIDARVRSEGLEPVLADMARGSVLLVLAHQGNWDLAGAWSNRHVGPITTVAERLEPPEVFDAFVELRAGFGLQILPLDSGADVFRTLVRTVRAGGAVVPLLADRDLTDSGLEVTLCGHPARVAAGPAALALATGAPLYATYLRHERLSGERRRAARSRWGLVLGFVKVEVPPGTEPGDRLVALTQAWVDVLGAEIAAHPTHWHMLQRVFTADLDPVRVGRRAGGHR